MDMTLLKLPLTFKFEYCRVSTIAHRIRNIFRFILFIKLGKIKKRSVTKKNIRIQEHLKL